LIDVFFLQNQMFLGIYCYDIPYIATSLLLQQFLLVSSDRRDRRFMLLRFS